MVELQVTSQIRPMRDFYTTICSLEEEQVFTQHHCPQAADLVLYLLTAKPQELRSEGGMKRSVCTTSSSAALTFHHLPSPVFLSKISKRVRAVVFLAPAPMWQQFNCWLAYKNEFSSCLNETWKIGCWGWWS